MVEIKPQRDVFWKALVYTIIIFLVGMFFGYLLEDNRVNKIENDFENLLLDWNDAEALSLYYQTVLEEDFCDQAIEQNVLFGDKIYEAGLRLEKYEEANRFNDNLLEEKKNYALLKIKFYINSKIIKERCNADYDYVFYFYLDDPELAIEQKQRTMSRVLLDLKYEMGDKIILIPLATDLDISVIDILVNKYKVEEHPTIVIKENIILDGIRTKEELMEFF
jgi:hypothetical protein